MPRLLIAVATSVLLATAAQSTPPTPSTEWPTYGHDAGGMRFSPLTQITPANVGQLEVAWVYHMKPPAAPPAAAGARRRRERRGAGTRPRARRLGLRVERSHAARRRTASCTSPRRTAASSRSIRRPARKSGRSSCRRAARRRAASSTGRATRRRRRRSSSASSDGKLYSLDAKTGKPNEAFGDNGIVNLNTPEIHAGPARHATA